MSETTQFLMRHGLPLVFGAVLEGTIAADVTPALKSNEAVDQI